MGAVVVKVEVEFSGSTWTDVSAWARMSSPITVTGGRSDTDSRVQPGRLSGLELDNDDGRFTVGNTAGAYSPNVRSGKRVRVSIKDPGSSTYYERFTGYIDGWPMRWESGHCFVTLSATDALGQLLGPIDPDAWVSLRHADTDTELYWPFTDNRVDLAHAEAGGGMWMLPENGNEPRPTTAGPPGVVTKLPTFDGGTAAAWTTPRFDNDGTVVDGAGTKDGYYCGCLFKSSDKSNAVVPLAVHTGIGDGIWVNVNTSGNIGISQGDPGVDPPDDEDTTVNICDGRWWYLLLRAYDAGSGSFTIAASATSIDDTSVVASATSAGNSFIDAVYDYAPVMLRVGSDDSTGTAFTVGHVAWRPGTDLGSGNPGTAFMEQFMGLADSRILGNTTSYPDDFPAVFNDLAPFPVECTNPTAYSSVPYPYMYRRPYSSGTWLDLWRQVEDVDGGVLFADREGRVVYTAGYYQHRPGWIPTGTGSARGYLALSLTAASVQSLEVAADRLKMVNDATVTLQRVGESGDQIVDELQVTDAGSIAATGLHAVTRTAYGSRYWWSASDTRGTGAIGLVHDLLEPTEVPRIPRVSVDAFTLPTAQQQDILKGDNGNPVGVWSLVGVTDLPSTGGFPSQWLGRVEGWSETIGATEWRIVFNTSFAGNRVGDSTFAKIGTMKLG